MLLVTAFVLTSVACSWKKPAATVSTFYEVTTDHGCEIFDDEIADEEVRALAKESAFSVKGTESTYLICSFIVTEDAASAKSIFAGTKENIKELVSGSTSSVSKTMSNYSYMRITDGNDVYYLARIDNTILHIVGSKYYDSE